MDAETSQARSERQSKPAPRVVCDHLQQNPPTARRLPRPYSAARARAASACLWDVDPLKRKRVSREAAARRCWSHRRGRTIDLVFGAVYAHMERMVAANYRLILTRADRYCVERTRPGEPAGKTSEFATQSMAHNWVHRNKEREAAFAQRQRVASRRPPWWITFGGVPEGGSQRGAMADRRLQGLHVGTERQPILQAIHPPFAGR